MQRKYFMPAVGQIYINRNGSTYRCISNAEYPDEILMRRAVDLGEHRSSMLRITDGWSITVHGICRYEDGSVEWNYSSGGSFQCERLALCQRKCRERGTDIGKYFAYLDDLRSSSIVNMYGAASYLQAAFPELNDDKTWVRDILTAWMDSYGKAGS